jgi:DNA adenine methylase
MRAPLAWLGGKSKLASTICDLFPEHRQYCEVFAGAGWVFFRKEPSRYEALNDINSDLVTFYRVIQHHFDEFCRQFKWLVASREQFDDWKRQPAAGGLTDIQRASRFYYLQRMAFGGKTINRSFGCMPYSAPRITTARIEEGLKAVHERLAGVIIECQPWDAFVARFDGPETLFYLDPPYWGCERDYGTGLFAREDFTRLAETMSRLKGKALLSLNDRPEVRAVFKAFNLTPVSTTYSVNGQNQCQAKELVIRNF